MPTDPPTREDASPWDRSHAAIVGELEELLVQGDAGVVATDLDGVITHWTSGAERLYGWSAGEAIGRHALELMVAPGDRAIAEALLESLRTRGVWEGEFGVQTKAGSTLPAYFRGALIKDDAGRSVGVLSLSMDVSA